MRATQRPNPKIAPTKDEVVDLRAIVREYKQEHRPLLQEELDSFRNEETLKAAIHRAALAKSHKGKRYRHQCRIKKESIKCAVARLSAVRASEFAKATDFAKLHDLVETALAGCKGLGPLYIYDTALRISAKKGPLPTLIYLHAGTRDGARNLDIDIKGLKVLDRSALPLPWKELQELQPYELEDLLCVYSDKFEPGASRRLKQAADRSLDRRPPRHARAR